MGTVRDIPDADLIGRVMNNIASKGARTGGQPMWATVADRFCLGSTYANQLCERYGFDPDLRVRK